MSQARSTYRSSCCQCRFPGCGAGADLRPVVLRTSLVQLDQQALVKVSAAAFHTLACRQPQGVICWHRPHSQGQGMMQEHHQPCRQARWASVGASTSHVSMGMPSTGAALKSGSTVQGDVTKSGQRQRAEDFGRGGEAGGGGQWPCKRPTAEAMWWHLLQSPP